MKKTIFLALGLLVSLPAYALGDKPHDVGLAVESRLKKMASDIYQHEDWQNAFHGDVEKKDYQLIQDLNPIRVYYKKTGVYVHTFSEVNLEEGYFIAPPNAQPPKLSYLTFEPIGNDVYIYKLDYKK